MSKMRHFMTVPRGCEDLAVAELAELGVEASAGRGGVRFDAKAPQLYRVAMWSRIGGRLLAQWADLPAADADQMYEAALAFPWEQRFGRATRFAISVTVARNAKQSHGRFAMHRLKDAIVDRFRAQGRPRPSVDLESPHLRIDLALHGDRATVSVDLVGESLHRRGLRDADTPAPLRENLAAALLARCHWTPERVLVDPMCGGGTILLEAWMQAADRAPGLDREWWAFESMADFDETAWFEVVDEARRRAEAGLAAVEAAEPRLFGYDQDSTSVAAARRAATHLGIENSLRLARRDVDALVAPAEAGLVLTNPPWGRRLEDMEGIKALYAAFGARVKEAFRGWEVGVLVGEASAGRWLGLYAHKRHKVHNGKVDCQLLRIDVDKASERKEAPRPPREAPPDLVNRLRKNLKARRRYAKRVDTDAFRVYDSDIPEYAVAIDLYGKHVHVAEYVAPADIPPKLARRRLDDALLAAALVFEVPVEDIAVKRRERQRGNAQYEKRDAPKELARDGGGRVPARWVVHEGPAQFEVNLRDYLDTGLFLDHRPIRAWLREHAAGKRFLNLFCYTASATVHAAIGGARSSVSVDLSARYLDWAERNFALNHLDPKAHVTERADVREWVDRCEPGSFDLLFVDPPTFSNSKRMDGTWDVQRDHVELLEDCARLLAPGGRMIFSTNARRFTLDPALEEKFEVREFGAEALPEDFARTPRIHHVFELVPRT